MGQLIRQIKKKNGLIRRFAEEEEAGGFLEINLILGGNIYLISICILCIYKRIITKDYYSIYKYLYYCIYCYKPYKNRYNNIYIIPLKDN